MTSNKYVYGKTPHGCPALIFSSGQHGIAVGSNSSPQLTANSDGLTPEVSRAQAPTDSSFLATLSRRSASGIPISRGHDRQLLLDHRCRCQPPQRVLRSFHSSRTQL